MAGLKSEWRPVLTAWAVLGRLVGMFIMAGLCGASCLAIAGLVMLAYHWMRWCLAGGPFQ